MITGQNYDDEIRIKVHHDGKDWCVVMELPGVAISYLTGEAAIKVAHALIQAGEEVVKKPI